MSRRPKPLLADQQSPNLLVKLRPAVHGLENNHLTEKMCKRGSVKRQPGRHTKCSLPLRGVLQPPAQGASCNIPRGATGRGRGGTCSLREEKGEYFQQVSTEAWIGLFVG